MAAINELNAEHKENTTYSFVFTGEHMFDTYGQMIDISQNNEMSKVAKMYVSAYFGNDINISAIQAAESNNVESILIDYCKQNPII